ncbi:MAG TPA: SRPBCC family protein [Pirellulales bacterium]|nr:SRPBCC family protein [Pirellulales bacterium]
MPSKNKNNPNELCLTRIYDAPVQAVWDAWTDPEQVAQWWGPRGFTLTTHGKDLRPGGHWTYTMHGPDGVDYPNKTLYYEVEPCAKLVYDHGGHDDRPPLFRVTVLFSEVKGGTKMEMTMAFANPEAAIEAGKFIKKASGDSTWDRLAEYLEKESSGKETFVIARAFDVPLEVMFQMWTDPEHFSRWLPLTGFDMQFVHADIKPGGSSLYFMSAADGAHKMYGRVAYLEIEKPSRIVYTQQFADEHGNVARHPMVSTWPETMLTTVTLTAEGPDRTRVAVTWEPHGATTREELETFLRSKAGMTQGWTGSFDKLEAYLENR